MSRLAEWDLAGYRLLSVDLRREFLDPVFVVLSDSGLGHVLLGGFLAVLVTHRFGKIWGALAAVAASAINGVFERDLLAALATLLDFAMLSLLPRASLIEAFKGAVVSGLVRLPLVQVWARWRPSNLELSRPLEPVFGDTSFPSGHTTTAFGLAVAVAWYMAGDEDSWIAWMLSGWALLVGLSRIYVGVHFPTDVVAGIALGAAVASFLRALMPNVVRRRAPGPSLESARTDEP